MSVAIYCRESTEKQNIETLISLCEKKAKELGFNDYIIYKDVKSGYSKDREDYTKLKNDIIAGEIDTLILYESSRLTRDEIEHHLFYATLRMFNVKVYTLNNGWLDLNNEDDIFLTGLLNLVDAREGRKTAKRVKDRMKEMAERGYWTGGPAPLGYTLVNKQLVVDDEKAKIVKDIFNLFLEGYSRSKIAELYGLENKRVRRMLKNPIYIGKLKFHQTEYINKKVIEHKEYKVLQGLHEPIIDEKIFELVQNKLQTIKREIKKDIYIFKDLLFCPCGSKLYFKFQGSAYKNKIYDFKGYYCPSSTDICLKSSIKEDELLKEVLENIENIIKNTDFSENTEDEEIIKDLKRYKKSKEMCFRKAETLTRNLLNGFISQEIFEKLMLENKTNETFYSNKIIQLENLIKNNEAKKTNSEIIKTYFEKIKNEKNPEKLNNFLKIIIEKIEFVNEFRMYIHLRL